MRHLLLFLCILTTSSLRAQTSLIELPFTIVEGYGPFLPKSSGLYWQDSTKPSAWSKTYRTLPGIPKDWKEVKQGTIPLDMYQSVYQDAATGKITPTFFKELQTSWGWTPDTAIYSTKPIKCVVQVATGIDSSGKSWLLLDNNNNWDFTDDTPFTVPPSIIMAILRGEVNVPMSYPVNYEAYQNGRVVPLQTRITFYQDNDRIMYHFPRYGVASLQALGSPKLLTLVGRGFTQPTFATAEIAVPNDTSNVGRRVRTNMSKTGEYVRINDKEYRYKGVDVGRQAVQLVPVDPADSLYSTQVGYKVRPFADTEFTSGKLLSLTDYRGKYVLIDFWGTWCAPCVGEIKHLKEAYAQTSRDDFEIIGIACNETPEKLRVFLDKQGVTWPQVMATTANKLTETYQVESWPTTFLIDPQGKVLLTNLRGSQTVELVKKLRGTKR